MNNEKTRNINSKKKKSSNSNMEIPFSTHQISKDVKDYYQYWRYGGKTGAFKHLWGE